VLIRLRLLFYLIISVTCFVNMLKSTHMKVVVQVMCICSVAEINISLLWP